MSEKVGGWLGFIAGLLAGITIGGLIVYVLTLRETRTLIKSFSYDETGRLIQVMKEHGV